MNHRLAKLFFLAPPTNTPWRGPGSDWKHPAIERADGRQIDVGLPLFWYDPPWYRLAIDRSDSLATAVGELGLLVSALRRDLRTPDGSSVFHGETLSVDGEQQDPPARPLGRIVPYRPERYGLANEDFDGAKIIDVRLTMNRDDSGRFAYSAEQIQRWAATPSGQPVSGGSWVPSATFPPDVASMQNLGVKLEQLRVLSPDAAVFVSLDPFRMENELTAIVENRPDGVILRLDAMGADGIDLAVVTQQARELIDRAGAPQLPLWIVPGRVSADDAAKLIVLGATAVAIDGWCDDLLENAASEDRSTAARLGYRSAVSPHASHMSQIVNEELQPLVTRFTGLLSSVQYLASDQRISSLSKQWCETLGLQSRIVPSSRR